MGFSNFIRQVSKRNATNHSELYKNRVCFTLESCTGSTIYSLTNGAFLAGFATMLGASDRYNGLIAVVPMMAGIIQFFAPFILEKIANRKTVIVIGLAVYKLLISLVVFIPLLIDDIALRLTFLFVSVSIAYSALNLILPGFTNWMTNSVPENVRGKYFGIKDSYSLAITTVITLIMGFVLDSFKEKGALFPSYSGFIIVFMVALVLTIINIIVLTKTKDIPVVLSKSALKLSDSILIPFKNKKFSKVIVFNALWYIGWNIGMPFLAIYQVKYLQLEYKYIMMLTLLTNITWIIAVRLWGRLADRLSWVNTSVYSILVLAFTNFIWGFITIKTLFLLPVVFILAGIAWGGINISLFNLPFMFVPEENKTVYLGVNAAFGGIMGLVATLVGGEVVSLLEGKKADLGIVSISNIQAVMILSSVLLLVCVVFAIYKLRNISENER